MNAITAFALAFTVVCFAVAFIIKHRSNTGMTPKAYTILSPMGRHERVVLYPQPYGKGIDREGNEYRIIDQDTAALIPHDA